VRHFVSPFFVPPKMMKGECSLYAEKVISYFKH